MSRHEAPAPHHHWPILHLVAALVALAIAASALSDPTLEHPAKVFTVTLFAGLAAITLYHAHTN